MGFYYEFGVGVPQNYAEAIKWYRRAAQQRHGDAQYALGCCYGEGAGVGRDRTEAAKWFRLAAAQGVSDAEEALAALEEWT